MSAPRGEGRLAPREKERVRVLYESHHQAVRRFLLRVGLDEALARDVMHQTFLVAISRLGDITETKERAFLIGAGLRLAKKVMSQAKAREAVSEEPVAVDPQARPDDQAEHRRRLRLLDATLRQLPEDLRVAFVLHDLEGYSQREIGELLEIPDGTAASRLRRARAAFDGLIDAHLEREAP